MILIALILFFGISAAVMQGLATWIRYDTRQRRRGK